MAANKNDIRELATCIIALLFFVCAVSIIKAVMPKEPPCSEQADPAACEEAKRKFERDTVFIAAICAAM